MGDNFCDFLFTFLPQSPLSKRDLLGSKLFLFKVVPFSEGRQNHSEIFDFIPLEHVSTTYPWKVHENLQTNFSEKFPVTASHSLIVWHFMLENTRINNEQNAW